MMMSGRKGAQEAETSRGTDVSMREVQGLADGDVHMVDGGTEQHDGMDVDGPAPGEDFRLDADENEDHMHRPVVKSKLNDALSSGKKVPAASSPSKPSSSTAKPTTWKSLVKLIPVAIPSKTPMKNKAQAKELEPEFSPYCLSSLVTSQVACELCAGFAYQIRTRQVGGKGRGSDTYQVEVRPHIPEEDVHANTRRREGGGGGRQGTVEPKSKAGASDKPKSGPSLDHLLVVV